MSSREKFISRITPRQSLKQAAITRMVVIGSASIICLLTTLLTIYDIAAVGHITARTLLGVGALAYLGLGAYLARHAKIQAANWLIIILFECLIAGIFLYWGINSAGLLALSFVIFLSSVLLGSRYTLPVASISIVSLMTVQTLHSTHAVPSHTEPLSTPTTFLDASSYSTILAVFALVLWLSQNQVEQSIQRARRAEEKLIRQKDRITAALERKTIHLRQSEILYIQQLYQFALIGQSSAAMLHELSNLLSILSLDINDLCKQSKASDAIKSAEETISHINKTVRVARRQLQTSSKPQKFDIMETVNASIGDITHKCETHGVHLRKYSKLPDGKAYTYGDPSALMQVMTILLNNAIEASQGTDGAIVTVAISASRKNNYINISVLDSGKGVAPEIRPVLFMPKLSAKPTGLGIGLYIARQLAKNHLRGSLRLAPQSSARGAHFVVSVPIR